jgi:hypothetical protein
MLRNPVVALALSVFFTLALPAEAAAQSTCTLPVSAYLTDGAGSPLDGAIDVELRFYDDGAPDALPIECRSTPATLESGWLRLLVDACGAPEPGDCGVVPLTSLLGSSESLWVGIRVDDDELTPRQLVGAVPYAVHAADAAALGGRSADEFASADELAAHIADGHDGGGVGVPAMTAMTTGGETCALVGVRPICWPYTDYFPSQSAYQVIDISEYAACGIDAVGAVECFDVASGDSEATPAGTFMDVAVGEGACALTTDGEAICWGRDDLASDAPAGAYTTIAIGNGGGRTACATGEVSGVVCWGGGTSSGGDDIIAGAPSIGTYSDVFVGDFFACAVDAVSGVLLCWGTTMPPPAGAFLSVSGGDHGACALRTDRTVHCWVNEERGSWRWDSANVPSGSGFTHVSAEGDRGCAIHESGEVYCWAARGRTPVNTEVPFGLRYR